MTTKGTSDGDLLTVKGKITMAIKSVIAIKDTISTIACTMLEEKTCDTRSARITRSIRRSILVSVIR